MKPGASAETGDEVVLDFDEWTLADLEEFEELTGVSFGDAFAADGRMPPAKVVTAAVWISRRKAEPELTLEAVRAMKATTLQRIRLAGDDEDEADPTSAPPGSDGGATAASG